METDVLILILRLGFAVLLYLFVFVVGIVVYRDFRRASRPVERRSVGGMGRLVVIETGETNLIQGQIYELQPVTSIGRNPSNNVALPDSFASGEHALLAWRDQQWWLEDLDSTNGTLLNRRPVQKPTPVSAGDVIQVGRIKLKLAR